MTVEEEPLTTFEDDLGQKRAEHFSLNHALSNVSTTDSNSRVLCVCVCVCVCICILITFQGDLKSHRFFVN